MLLVSIGLLRQYINLTIITLDIIYRPVSRLKHYVMETDFCLHLQVKPVSGSETEPISFLDPSDLVSPEDGDRIHSRKSRILNRR
jgi:hypothetical protein